MGSSRLELDNHCSHFHIFTSFYSLLEWTSKLPINDYSPRDLLKADVYSFCATMCWLCVPELRLSRLVDPIQHQTIIGVGEAAQRHVTSVELTSDDLAWIDELSSSSEQEQDKEKQSQEESDDENEEDTQWGKSKKDWQSIIRSGLCQQPQDRPTMLELYGKLVSLNYKLKERKN